MYLLFCILYVCLSHYLYICMSICLSVYFCLFLSHYHMWLYFFFTLFVPYDHFHLILSLYLPYLLPLLVTPSLCPKVTLWHYDCVTLWPYFLFWTFMWSLYVSLSLLTLFSLWSFYHCKKKKKRTRTFFFLFCTIFFF